MLNLLRSSDMGAMFPNTLNGKNIMVLLLDDNLSIFSFSKNYKISQSSAS